MEALKNSRYLGFWSGLAFFAVMALVAIYLQSQSGGDASLRTLNNIGIFAALALSLNVILGQTGLFNMGHIAFFALGAYTTAVLNSVFGWPVIYTLPVAALVTAAFAFLAALPVIHLRGDYLLVVTIGISEILRIAFVNDIFGLTQGPNGITGVRRIEIFGYRFMTQFSQFYLIWGFVAITACLFYFLEHSRFGRALNYIKYDEVAASGNGINTVRYKLIAFTLGAMWAGMVGTIYAPFIRTISPGLFEFKESVLLFAIVILAGGGNIVGIIIASFLLVGMRDVLTMFGDWSMLLFGLMMVVLMIVRPQGILKPRRRRYAANEFVGKFPNGIARGQGIRAEQKAGEAG